MTENTPNRKEMINKIIEEIKHADYKTVYMMYIFLLGDDDE